MSLLEPHPLPSTKKIGEREKKIIQQLCDYFSMLDFRVFPHSSLNIAWGSIIIDLDLVLIKNDMVSYIEVKSKKDHFKNAIKQINNVKDFIDYAWIASDRNNINFKEPDIGLILLFDEKIRIENQPKKINDDPNFYSVLSLKKKCLTHFFSDLKNTKLVSKYSLAKKIFSINNLCNKQCLKEIALCSQQCTHYCPIDSREKILYYL